jgi:hypothetical protein
VHENQRLQMNNPWDYMQRRKSILQSSQSPSPNRHQQYRGTKDRRHEFTNTQEEEFSNYRTTEQRGQAYDDWDCREVRRSRDRRLRERSVDPDDYRQWRDEYNPDSGRRADKTVPSVGQPNIPKMESAERLERKHRQHAHELQIRKREDEGKKPHYVLVDSDGQPY